jgi:hypothetical protein
MQKLTDQQCQVLKRLVGSGRIEADALGVGRTLASLTRRGYAQRKYNSAGGTWEYRPTPQGKSLFKNAADGRA